MWLTEQDDGHWTGCLGHKTVVIPVRVCGSETGRGRDGYEETEYMGEENIKKDIRTGGRARNMESKN